MFLQVGDGGAEHCHVFLQEPDAAVAANAEQATDMAGAVVVIDAERGWAFADRAATLLGDDERVPLGEGQTVDVAEPSRPSVPRVGPPIASALIRVKPSAGVDGMPAALPAAGVFTTAYDETLGVDVLLAAPEYDQCAGSTD